MRKNSLKRSTFNPLTQKAKTPHLLKLEDERDGLENELSGRLQLPSLPRRRSWKDEDNLSNGNSAATSVSWSQEAENVATQKLEEQWMTVERSFYEEDEQLSPGPVLDECTQWRTQIPYLRIIGTNPICIDNSSQRNLGSAEKSTKKLDDRQSDDVFVERSFSLKEDDSAKNTFNKAKLEEVLDLLMEHVIAELSSDDDNDDDGNDDDDDDANSLTESLSDTLKITPAPVHGGRNSSKGSKTNWAEEAVSPNYIENKSQSIRNRLLDTESSFQTKKDDLNHQGTQKRQDNSVSANKLRDFGGTIDDDDASMRAPHIGRNKLGTVFNERIVVSPVPFAISTRESFSTLKTTPIRFMDNDLEISSFQGSARNVPGFRSSAKKSSSLKNPEIHSAWQAPVCPTVWPKNVRLAPIDTSRLPSSKNRSLAPSPAVLHCSKRPLSPLIPRPTIPKSAHVPREHSDLLEIQGRHIIPAQTPKVGLLSAGWDYSPRVVKSRKKKTRAKEGL